MAKILIVEDDEFFGLAIMVVCGRQIGVEKPENLTMVD
jgi:hypothetical protein